MGAAWLRLALWLVSRVCYRRTVIGRDRVPTAGGALLVPSHLTPTEAALLSASVDRPIRFLTDGSLDQRRWLRPFVEHLRPIRIDPAKGPVGAVRRALEEAARCAEAGELVCVLSERPVGAVGLRMPLGKSLERLGRRVRAPVVPVFLDRVWGGVFDYERQRLVFSPARRLLRCPVTIRFGEPMTASEPAWRVREAVQELGRATWEERTARRPPLHRMFIRTARRRPWRLLFGDATRPRLTRLGALAGAILVARRLRPVWAGQRRIGLLLPPSVGGALANLAVTLTGRTSVNLNYSSGSEALAAAVRQAGLRIVLTNRRFLERAEIELPAELEPHYIEDVLKEAGRGERLLAPLLALLAPTRLIEHACGGRGPPAPDDELTVIFSSGSTGEPKGIVLSHRNLDANVGAVAGIFQPDGGDGIVGILPLFHSFGYLALWYAAIHGVGLAFSPNPLDSRAVARLIERYRLTILVATPTFLRLYARRCDPSMLRSLRLVLSGAEKLTPEVAEAVEARLGVRPIEGYGLTECAPVVAAEEPDFRGRDAYPPATSRRNTVGRAVPGVVVRIAVPETLEPAGDRAAGLLLVRGPNVMRGYLGRADLTAEAMHEGWYVTGDVGRLDGDGLIRILDRLARFSKIGGEMVPHGRIERALHEAAGVSGDELVFAVTGLPDERKGERLVVLHRWEPDRISELVDRLSAMGLPPLYIPRPERFVRVEEIPTLATGKLNLKQIKRVAHEKVRENAR